MPAGRWSEQVRDSDRPDTDTERKAVNQGSITQVACTVHQLLKKHLYTKQKLQFVIDVRRLCGRFLYCVLRV